MQPVSRREFLDRAVGAALVSPWLQATPKPRVERSSRRMIQMGGYPINAETPLDALTSYLTPNDLFFVRSHWVPNPPNPKTWALAIDGDVDRPLRLSLGDLKKLPQTSVTCVLQCTGNGRGLQDPFVPGLQWQFGAVGNARWTGVRVKDILDRAGLKSSARHLQTSGSDKPPLNVPPFNRSVPIDKVLDDCLVAFQMNGVPLPELHGGPARLVVPGWTGNHWMKWLDRISPQADPQKGFFMDTAYRFPRQPGAPGVAFKPEEMDPVTRLVVKSNITQAPRQSKVGTAFTIDGFAFSGTPDVAKVDISTDDGASWVEADLGKEHDPYAWRRWSFAITPKIAGTMKVSARATDSSGNVQPRQAVWNQSGYLFNAWHTVDVEVLP
jgi:sulfite oxidase